eukprot:370175-Amorphochlora_amoeboformis.AAC.1
MRGRSSNSRYQYHIQLSSYVYFQQLEIAGDSGDSWKSSHPVVTGWYTVVMELRGGVTKRDVASCHKVIPKYAL